MAPDAPSGTRLLVMTDVNRRRPSTSGAILRVVPKSATVELGDEPERSGWLHVEHDGVQGWMSAQFLTLLPPDLPGDIDGPASPQNSILRASKSVGFSYWWGGGAWLASGVTESSAGSCSGGCPNCTHTGRYGADCSGMVAKAWQFGRKNLAENDHPYGTIHFIEERPGLWTRVARESLKPGDALVQNNGRTGHIVLYEKGDAWNTPTVYECKGCQSGCVYNARAFGAAYVGLRREGF